VTGEQDPVELATRALRHRDRSRRQVADRLRQAGVDEARSREALETLERLGYVDDDRFAAGRAAELAERGYGDAGIRQLLTADGVEEEAIGAAVASLEPERERARRIITRLGPSARTAGRLARKGFGAESVAEAAGGGFAVDGWEA
jgi:regulatory protein